MSVRRIKAGTTDVSITLRIVDSTDGTPETGVVFNTSGIDLWYRRDGAASVDITEATLAALTTAHTDGGFLAINDGWYRLDLPDAACATGVAGVQIGGTVTGMVVLAPYIELPVNTEEDVYTRIGAPAGASLAADIAVIEGQTDDIGVAGAGLTAINLPDQTMNITGNITGNLSGSVGSVTGAVGSVTGAVGSVTGNVGGNVTGSVGSLATQAKADVNAEVDTAISDAALATAANLATVAGYLDTEIAAILEDTGTTLPDLIAALNNLSAAEVNAEVVDALATDTYAEPGQGAPAATTALATKIGFLYKAWRNRHTQDGSEYALYADDATTKDQEAVVSDDNTTFERGEVGTGA